MRLDARLIATLLVACGALGALTDARAKARTAPLASDGQAGATAEREDVAAACAYAARIPPDSIGDYTFRSGVFDIDGDGTFETVLGTVVMGRMGGDAFEVSDAAGRLVPWTESDVAGGAGLLAGARWLPFRGRAYLLGFEDERAGFLVRLSYPDTGHRLRLGCTFTTKVDEALLPTGEGPAQVCRAVADGQAEAVPVVEDPNGVLRRLWTRVDGRTAVDLTGTGRAVSLERLSYSSSGGRGCDATYFDTEDRGGDDGQAHRDLMDLQRIDADAGRDDDTPRECGGLIRRWLRVEGRTYLETRYPGQAPQGDRQMVHRIQAIIDGKPRTVCEAAFSRTWSLVPNRRVTAARRLQPTPGTAPYPFSRILIR